jgi:hypothetical protein
MSPSRRAPDLAYPFAMAAGLFSLIFYGTLSVIADTTVARDEEYVGALIILLASFAVGHFVLGGAFGLLWRRATWRWGVWLCALPACVISFYGQGVWFFLGWLALTMLPACAGSYVGAELQRRYLGG